MLFLPLQLTVWLSSYQTVSLPVSLFLPQTNCTSVWSSIQLSPLSAPCTPSTHTHGSFGLSLCLCLSIRNERNLQQKQQLAGGPMSHDALHGARRALQASHSAFYCVGSSTITFAFTDTHLIFTDWRVVMAWTMTATDTDQFITVKLGGAQRRTGTPGSDMLTTYILRLFWVFTWLLTFTDLFSVFIAKIWWEHLTLEHASHTYIDRHSASDINTLHNIRIDTYCTCNESDTLADPLTAALYIDILLGREVFTVKGHFKYWN